MKAKLHILKIDLIIVLFGYVLTSFNYLYAQEIKQMNEELVITLIGASVGKGWNFPDLPTRLGIKGYKTEYIGVFDTFDKTPAIDKVIKKSKKPDYVIIKECSVYFPGDINQYKSKIKTWVKKLRDNEITPILATTVPISPPNTMTSKLKDTIKSLLGKPNKLNEIVEYNNWIREYAKSERIHIVDMEATLRISGDYRYMDPRYDRGDRVHLNPTAYSKLDEMMRPILNEIKK